MRKKVFKNLIAVTLSVIMTTIFIISPLSAASDASEPRFGHGVNVTFFASYIGMFECGETVIQMVIPHWGGGHVPYVPSPELNPKFCDGWPQFFSGVWYLEEYSIFLYCWEIQEIYFTASNTTFRAQFRRGFIPID